MTTATTETAIDTLRTMFPVGSTAYCVLRSRSQSGMSRQIGFVSIRHSDGRQPLVFHPNYLIGQILGLKLNKVGDGITVRGCGMDMGFHVVNALSRALYPDASVQAITHQWL